MAFSRPVFTNAGKELQAKALAGECEIKFTAIALGSGELITQSIAELTDLIKPIKRCELTEIKHTAIDTIQLKSKFENTSQTSGFYWREVGLFAADPNEPSNRAADILYCYQNAGDIAEYIAAPEQQIIDKILCMAIAISDSAKVSAVIKSELYADREEFNAHLSDAEAHKNLLNNFAKSVNTYGVLKNNNIELSVIRNSYAEDNQKYSSVLGGAEYGQGAGLFAYGAKHAEYQGYFDLYAMTSEGEKAELVGKPNGQLTWGGTLEFNKNNGGTISREYAVSMWYNARNYALLQQKSLPSEGYGPLFSLKTNNGSWECGAWNYDADNLIFSFIDDEKYNLALAEDNQGITPTENNTPVMQFLFDKNGQIRSRLDAISDRFFVKSVNGVNADSAGNVQLGNIGAITGEIKWFAFNTAPDGYLVCNGANVSRETYADLFAVIGTTFGSGDGSTTFALPNLIDRFAQGSTTVGTVKSAGLPNITGSTQWEYMGYTDINKYDGAFGVNRDVTPYSGETEGGIYARRAYPITFNASKSNSIYGNSSTVQPPALTLLPCIKY